MNRSTAITISSPSAGKSRAARRRQRRRQNRQQGNQSQSPVKVEVNPFPSPQSRQRRRRGQGRRRQINPYLATILDPENVRGVKVPDAVTLPTGTWTFTADGTMTPNSAFNGLILVVPGNVINSTGTAVGQTVISCSGTGAAADFALTSATSPTNPSISASFARVRPVSGYINVWSTQPAINIAGSACSFLIPEGTTTLALPTLTSFAAFAQLPYNKTNHLAEGGTARYCATDPSEFDFLDVGGQGTLTGYTTSTGILNGLAAGISAFGVAVSGTSAGAVLRYRVVLNYEVTPSSDTIGFIDREPSPSNTGWLNDVNRFLVEQASALFASPAGSEIARISASIGTRLISRATGSLLGYSGGRLQDQRSRLPSIELM